MYYIVDPASANYIRLHGTSIAGIVDFIAEFCEREKDALNYKASDLEWLERILDEKEGRIGRQKEHARSPVRV